MKRSRWVGETKKQQKKPLQLLFPRAQNKCNDLSNVTRKQFGLGYWILTVWPLALSFKQFVCFTPQARLSPEWALRSLPSSSWCSPFVWREHPPRKKELRKGRKKGSRFTARRKYGTPNTQQLDFVCAKSKRAVSLSTKQRHGLTFLWNFMAAVCWSNFQPSDTYDLQYVYWETFFLLSKEQLYWF